MFALVIAFGALVLAIFVSAILDPRPHGGDADDYGSSWTVRCGAATWDMSHFSILLGPGAEFSLICGATLLAIHIDKGLQCTQ